MKKIFIVTFILTIILCGYNCKAIELSARSAVLYEPITGRVIYEKNKDEKLPMASTTKIVTAITAIENGNLSDVVTTSKTAANVEGSSIWLSEGETHELEDLLYGLMLSSGNDAAIAIAESVGGSIDNFAVLMNQTANKAGALNSSFKNPNGLDQDGHYTTAEDLAKITAYGMKNPVFKEIVSTKTKSIPWVGHQWNRTLQNHNKMLRLYEGCDGVKTGFTKKSGRCLVTSATRNGFQLIAVTINAPNDWDDHKKLLDYGFESLQSQEIIKITDELPSVKVENGSTEYISLKYNSNLSLPLFTDDKFEIKYEIPQHISAPIECGDKIGFSVVYINNNEVARVEIVSKDKVEEIKKAKYFKTLYNTISQFLNLVL